MQLGVVLNIQAEEGKHLMHCTRVPNCTPRVPLPSPHTSRHLCSTAGTRSTGTQMSHRTGAFGGPGSGLILDCPYLSPQPCSEELILHQQLFKDNNFSRKLNLTLSQSQLMKTCSRYSKKALEDPLLSPT